MTEESRYLIELATRNALAYTSLPGARAAMLSGSAAEGESDRYSDIDMMIYYDELPCDEALNAAREQNGGSERIWQAGDRDNGVLMEAYRVNGVECQVVHATVAAWERDMATVLEQHVVDSPLQKALSGLLYAIPLYGNELIAEWKARAAAYPDGLRDKMVMRHLTFFPIWGMEERFFSRDATLWFHQVRVEILQNVLGALAGLNRVYYTTFQFKHAAAFVRQLKVAPENLNERIEEALAACNQEAVPKLDVLVRETVDLVEREMPQIDTSGSRRRIDHRPEPWTMINDELAGA